MIIGLDANEANVLRRVGSNEYAFQVLWQLYRQGTDHQWVIYLSHEPQTDLPQPKPNWQYRVLKPGFFWTQWRLPLDLLFHSPPAGYFSHLRPLCPAFFFGSDHGLYYGFGVFKVSRYFPSVRPLAANQLDQILC